MVLPISIHVPAMPIQRAAPPRVVEPVCETTCNCEDLPPINAFALPPMPFAKFLERENIIDRFQKTPQRSELFSYGPKKPKAEVLGTMIDVQA